jgi:hypothetical protein
MSPVTYFLLDHTFYGFHYLSIASSVTNPSRVNPLILSSNYFSNPGNQALSMWPLGDILDPNHNNAISVLTVGANMVSELPTPCI